MRLGLEPDEAFGDQSLVEITPEIQDKVQRVQRGRGEAKDQITVNIIEGIKPPEADLIIVTLKKESKEAPPVVYTVFTGMRTPSLPRREEQSEEEFEYNREFWDRHAFIK